MSENQIRIEFSGEKISADKFTRGVTAFLNFIEEISDNITGKEKSIQMDVSVEPGSVRLIFTPSKYDPANIVILQNSIRDGIETVNTEPKRPPFFSDDALRSIKVLSSIVKDKKDGLESIGISMNGTRVVLSNKLIENVDKIIGYYYDLGSIEGKLMTLSARKGYHIVVYDFLSDKAIRCIFDEYNFDIAKEAFQKRVYVYGLIKYRKDGKPVSIKVKDLQVFPDQDSLPNIDNIIGILKD